MDDRTKTIITILLFIIFLFVFAFLFFPRPEPPIPTETIIVPTDTEVVLPTRTLIPTKIPTKVLPTETLVFPTDVPPTKILPTKPVLVYICTGYTPGWAHWREGPSKMFYPLWWYDENGKVVGGWLEEGTQLELVRYVEPSVGIVWAEVLYQGEIGYTWKELICEY